MATCATCGNFIIFGGTRGADGERYCNTKCQRASGTAVAGIGGSRTAKQAIAAAAAAVPDQLVLETARAIHAGPCPACQGAGPVDVHQSHTAMSFLVMTRWASKQHIVCRGCATKRQAGALGISLFAGWWGFPWGLVMTPIQVGRNLVGLCGGGPKGAEPSPMLQRHARTLIALRHAQSVQPVNGRSRGFEVVVPAMPPMPAEAIPLADPVPQRPA